MLIVCDRVLLSSYVAVSLLSNLDLARFFDVASTSSVLRAYKPNHAFAAVFPAVFAGVTWRKQKETIFSFSFAPSSEGPRHARKRTQPVR